MTNNEIIKAFECCYTDADCEECPLYSKENHRCTDIDAEINIPKKILDLINRLKVNIEEHKDQFDRMSKVAHKLHSELVSLKVGIEKLKENVHTIDDDYSPNGELTYIEADDIDNLLKETGCE